MSYINQIKLVGKFTGQLTMTVATSHASRSDLHELSGQVKQVMMNCMNCQNKSSKSQ